MAGLTKYQGIVREYKMRYIEREVLASPIEKLDKKPPSITSEIILLMLLSRKQIVMGIRDHLVSILGVLK